MIVPFHVYYSSRGCHSRKDKCMSAPDVDPRNLTFSQAQGLEELPRSFALGELPPEARNRLWDVFHMTSSMASTSVGFSSVVVGQWHDVLLDVHVQFSHSFHISR